MTFSWNCLLCFGLTLLQLLQNRGFQTLRLRRARPPLLDLPILADQKLFKVPLDPLQAHQPGLALLHPLVDGLGVGAVDVGLAEDGEGDAVVGEAEGLDVVVAARVLVPELVAGKADDFEVWVGGFELWRKMGRLVCGLERWVVGGVMG